MPLKFWDEAFLTATYLINLLPSGIVKPKKVYDGMIRYGNFCSTGEPESVQEALDNSNWRKAMEDEYMALL